LAPTDQSALFQATGVAKVHYRTSPETSGVRSIPCRRARAFIITKKTVTRISTLIVEVIMPPTIGAAIGFITSDPTPVSHKIGTSLARTAATVISLGRRRWTAPSIAACSISTRRKGDPAASLRPKRFVQIDHPHDTFEGGERLPVNDLATAVWEGQTGTCAPAQPLNLLRRFILRNPDTLSIKQFVEPASSHPMRRRKTSNPQSDRASWALGGASAPLFARGELRQLGLT
jgi:hypothetical protein